MKIYRVTCSYSPNVNVTYYGYGESNQAAYADMLESSAKHLDHKPLANQCTFVGVTRTDATKHLT